MSSWLNLELFLSVYDQSSRSQIDSISSSALAGSGQIDLPGRKSCGSSMHKMIVCALGLLTTKARSQATTNYSKTVAMCR